MHSNAIVTTALPSSHFCGLELSAACTRKMSLRHVFFLTFSYRLLVKLACRRHLGFVETPNTPCSMALLDTQPALRHTLLFLVMTLSRRLRDEVRRAYSGVESTSRAEEASLRKGPRDLETLCTLSASYWCVVASPPITRRLLALLSQRLSKYLIRPLFHLKKTLVQSWRQSCCLVFWYLVGSDTPEETERR